ncbi:hypothetical protein [Carnimonas bestiolae]|uniref:hypothetical protein n=1 Tax=Carnimonas bestiolae TaxID=3402172 RepID=UPI003F4AA1B7
MFYTEGVLQEGAVADFTVFQITIRLLRASEHHRYSLPPAGKVALEAAVTVFTVLRENQ